LELKAEENRTSKLISSLLFYVVEKEIGLLERRLLPRKKIILLPPIIGPFWNLEVHIQI
jgi:hypothetical protein